MACTEPTPLGQYGDSSYGDGLSPCDSPDPTGFGDGVGGCETIIGDPCLVATITRLTDTLWIGHRVENFGGGVFQASSFPECKRLVQDSVGTALREVVDDAPGRPAIVYLKVRAPCL